MSYVTGLITIPPRLSGQKGFVTLTMFPEPEKLWALDTELG